ncbi:MAG: phosphogluconate dehydratase [Gammaproteobacteria bacterium]
MNPTVARVTERIVERSRPTRGAYLERMRAAAGSGPRRTRLSCGNLAHGFAACGSDDKHLLAAGSQPNLGIVSAYNDMLSAHQPLRDYPEVIKSAAADCGAVAQFAGGVPAMCDGVTQGRAGMELSLFSRDVIAQATAIALAHDMFDAALCLGVCDKIVPGMLIGALAFGHLPFVFVPAGPMPSGIANREKARIRALYAEGRIDRAGLLAAESASYHAPGTCTFYGTANSNQMLMEVMGLHVPGSAFVPPGTALRQALTAEAARMALGATALGGAYRPIASIVDERTIVNAIVGLLATGGSTNHTIHLVAVARTAGILIDWQDFADLSAATPLIARVYPNGAADVNQFHAAGGLGFVIGTLIDAGLIDGTVATMAGDTLAAYRREPYLDGETLAWRDAPPAPLDRDILRPAQDPFDSEGGIRLLSGNLGRAVIKVSAVAPAHRTVQAPAAVFESQDEVLAAFERGRLDRDVVVVLRGQGPRANGMPELHKLTPALGVLMDRGHRVALVTDGRMSGASGKVPAAIHVTPESGTGGPLARVRDGDIVCVDADRRRLDLHVDAATLAGRAPVRAAGSDFGTGRELFAAARTHARSAEEGAVTFESVPFTAVEESRHAYP